MQRFAFDECAQDTGSPLARLLQPIDIAAFFEQHWDRQPVLVQGGGRRRFDDIMTADDFQAVVFDAKLGSPNLRYLQKSIGGRADSLDYFLRKKASWTEPLSLAHLARELHCGTLVYVAIESAVASVASSCRRLFTDLKCPVSFNAYFSAGRDASAFDAHFDPQDVFILQLEGEKEWRLWENGRVANPISGHPNPKSQPQPSLPADETMLMTPGDLLYVPRGTWHWPRSLDDNPSLHLTATMVMPRPVDIIQWLTHELSQEPGFRAALPMSPYQAKAADIGAMIGAAITFAGQQIDRPDARALAAAHMLRAAVQTMIPPDPLADEPPQTF